MTCETVLQASDDQLKSDLKLTKLSDRLYLRAFCKAQYRKGHTSFTAQEENKEARKRRLIEELAKKRKPKGSHPPTSRGHSVSITKNTV